jgi:hypothetical protein
LDWVEETKSNDDTPPGGSAPSVYERSLAATQDQPDDVSAWIARAETAMTAEEKIFCLSQVSRLDPSHPQGKEQMQHTLWGELQRDSFLGYLEETDRIYYVRSSDFTSLAIAKDRAAVEAFPPEKDTAVDHARRRLGWAIAGLALSGLGTLIFVPLAVRSAYQVLGETSARSDRIRAWIVIALSLLLAPIALALAWVFVLHI